MHTFIQEPPHILTCIRIRQYVLGFKNNPATQGKQTSATGFVAISNRPITERQADKHLHAILSAREAELVLSTSLTLFLSAKQFVCACCGGCSSSDSIGCEQSLLGLPWLLWVSFARRSLNGSLRQGSASLRGLIGKSVGENAERTYGVVAAAG